MKQQFSQLKKLPYIGSNLPPLQMVHKVKIVVLLLILCITFTALFASGSAKSEIFGPESGVVDLRYIPDDQVVALTWKSEVIPDKFQYEIGETVTVKFTISVDPQSRGYKPDKQYYLISPYTTGHSLGADFDLCWTVLKSNIDSLEIVRDGNPTTGEIEVRLYRSRFIPRFKQADNGMTIYYTPQDTTKAVKFNKSGPPLFKFRAYRICEDIGKGIKYCDSKHSFEYDQYRGVNISGKIAPEIWKQKMDSNNTPKK
ncbi:MAG: hypothetical protein PHO32_00295 [Candidatus Cloacimonetes bacterium]|nr:hypothetical protein [Candidatus Cloacimonadota bacterium]